MKKFLLFFSLVVLTCGFSLNSTAGSSTDGSKGAPQAGAAQSAQPESATATKSLLACSDSIIEKDMHSQVEATLEKTRAFIVSDANLRSEIAKTKRPLMLLIYNNDQDFSQGLAAVVACELRNYPQIRCLAYGVPELSQEELDNAARYAHIYIQSVPSLLIYDYKDNRLGLVGTLHEGYRDLALVKKQIVRLSAFIDSNVVH